LEHNPGLISLLVDRQQSNFWLLGDNGRLASWSSQG